jgi:hypothetical protein
MSISGLLSSLRRSLVLRNALRVAYHANGHKAGELLPIAASRSDVGDLLLDSVCLVQDPSVTSRGSNIETDGHAIPCLTWTAVIWCRGVIVIPTTIQAPLIHPSCSYASVGARKRLD